MHPKNFQKQASDGYWDTQIKVLEAGNKHRAV